MRGRQEIPGLEDTYFPDMTAGEFSAALQSALNDYESTFQYTALALMPAEIALPPIAIVGGLALAVIVILALLRGRKAR